MPDTALSERIIIAMGNVIKQNVQHYVDKEYDKIPSFQRNYIMHLFASGVSVNMEKAYNEYWSKLYVYEYNRLIKTDPNFAHLHPYPDIIPDFDGLHSSYTIQQVESHKRKAFAFQQAQKHQKPPNTSNVTVNNTTTINVTNQTYAPQPQQSAWNKQGPLTINDAFKEGQRTHDEGGGLGKAMGRGALVGLGIAARLLLGGRRR